MELLPKYKLAAHFHDSPQYIDCVPSFIANIIFNKMQWSTFLSKRKKTKLQNFKPISWSKKKKHVNKLIPSTNALTNIIKYGKTNNI